jgi:predicted DNA-binding transcriptional regulator AlpA
MAKKKKRKDTPQPASFARHEVPGVGPVPPFTGGKGGDKSLMAHAASKHAPGVRPDGAVTKNTSQGDVSKTGTSELQAALHRGNLLRAGSAETAPTPRAIDPLAAMRDHPAAGRPASLAAAVEPALLLSAKQAAALCGISPATWARWNAAGRIPAPIRLSPGCVRWRRAELVAWCDAGCPDRHSWEAMKAANNTCGRIRGG